MPSATSPGTMRWPARIFAATASSALAAALALARSGTTGTDSGVGTGTNTGVGDRTGVGCERRGGTGDDPAESTGTDDSGVATRGGMMAVTWVGVGLRGANAGTGGNSDAGGGGAAGIPNAGVTSGVGPGVRPHGRDWEGGGHGVSEACRSPP